MLSRRRHLVRLLVTGAVLATASLALTAVGPAQAAGDPCPASDLDCTIEANDPGNSGSGDGGDNGGGSSGGGPCFAQGQYGPVEVSCYDDSLGPYVGGNCYLRPAPEHTEPPPAGAEVPGGWYWRYCMSPHGNLGVYEWIPDGDAPALTPAQRARRALASIRLLPADIHIAPDPSGSGLVGLPVWMWTTVNDDTWGPISASDSDAGLTVSITAQAVSIAWSMGDGARVTCRNPGTPYDASFGNRRSPTCGYVYASPSSGRPGGVFPVTATTTWRVSWSGGGQSGVITVLRQSGTTVRIGERHGVTE